MKSVLSAVSRLTFSKCACACCARTCCARLCCAGATLLSGLACSSSPQDFVELPLVVRGTNVQEVEAGDDVALSLTRADVAFGPLYVCAGAQAGDHCDTARLEWRESAVVDTLNEDATEIGMLAGVTGEVRSWMFDYGITSLLTQSEPQILHAARELGDVSLVVEGVATLSGTEVPFVIETVVQQTNETERGVPVVRKSTSDVFGGEVTENTASLEVVFDPAAWLVALRRTDFEALALDCEIGVDTECEAVFFDSSSRVGGVVSQAMTSGVRPTFRLR